MKVYPILSSNTPNYEWVKSITSDSDDEFENLTDKNPAQIETSPEEALKIDTSSDKHQICLFCFIRICKFGSFKNRFAMVTTLTELSFRSRRFILLVQAAENDGHEQYLT